MIDNKVYKSNIRFTNLQFSNILEEVRDRAEKKYIYENNKFLELIEFSKKNLPIRY